MSKKFKFTPTEVEPQSVIAIDGEPKQSRPMFGTDAQRIASAKARCIVRSKESSADPQYGAGHASSYWQDFAGPETSEYRFDHLMFLLGFLKDPKFEYLSHNYSNRDYDQHTGIWTCGDIQIPIQDLKDALAARIAKLGISEVLLFEYLVVPHSWQEDQRFYGLSFDERVQKLVAA